MKSRLSARSMSNKSAVSRPSTTNAGKNRNIMQPSIPSNLEDADLQAQFNSIGYYGDLLGRLDNQIKTTEDVYKNSFFAVQHQTQEKDLKLSARGNKVFSLHELKQVKPATGLDGKGSVIDLILASQAEFYARTAPKKKVDE